LSTGLLDRDAIDTHCRIAADRAVNDLMHEVEQAAAVIGVADVHARALAHTLQPP
jgi:hypothetical protein